MTCIENVDAPIDNVIMEKLNIRYFILTEAKGIINNAIYKYYYISIYRYIYINIYEYINLPDMMQLPTSPFPQRGTSGPGNIYYALQL